MSQSIIQQAFELFKDERYEAALELYAKASVLLGERNVKANISICRKRLHQASLSLSVAGAAVLEGASLLKLIDVASAKESAVLCLNQVDERELHAEFSRSIGLAPGVTVVIPSHKGQSTIEATLLSLGNQTLHHDMFEVVVVFNGERDGSVSVFERMRARFHQVDFKGVFVDAPGVGNARNIGIAAALREYITFVDDDDQVTPNYLAGLLGEAGPDKLVLAQLVDVKENKLVESPISRQVRLASGRFPISFDDVHSMLTMNACKLAPTSFARQVAYDDALRSGEDVDYWVRFLRKFNPKIAIVPEAAESVYQRTVRPGSVSRQPMSFEFNVIQRLDVVAKLEIEWQGSSDENMTRFIHNKIIAQADFSVRYLKERGDEYAKFSGLMRSRQFVFPVARYINTRLAKTLVISYCFPPYIDTAGVVAAKRVREFGVPVDVVCNTMANIRPLDQRLMRVVDDLLGKVVQIDTPPSFSTWASIEKFCDTSIERIRQLEGEAGKERYRTVYSRAMWVASHFAAAAYKVKNPNVFWIAEFSDPLLLDIHSKKRTETLSRQWLESVGINQAIEAFDFPVPSGESLFFWGEFIPYILADKLIFTNENQLEHMLSYIENPRLGSVVRKKATIKPHPTLSREYYGIVQSAYRIDSSKLNVAYFGSFYDTRGLMDVFEALLKIPYERREIIKIHVFTEQAEKVRGDKALSELGGNIVINKYVGYLEFLNLSSRFDCLIVNDAVTKGVKALNPYLPSKLSDYKGGGSNVWAICEPGSPMDKLASAGEVAYRSEVGDLGSHVRVIMSLLATKS